MNIDDNSNILLMFSGGLDSTGALWKLIQNKKNIVHIYHLHLANKENRTKAEGIAVKKIVDYITKISHVNYSESYHQYPSYNNSFMFDSDLYNFMAGTVCKSLPNIQKVAIGRTKSDFGIEERSMRGTNILRLLSPNIEKIYPVGDMTKIEIYNMLPKELRDMTWSCRTPVYVSEKIIKECGQCKTCRELGAIKNENGI